VINLFCYNTVCDKHCPVLQFCNVHLNYSKFKLLTDTSIAVIYSWWIHSGNLVMIKKIVHVFFAAKKC